MPAFIEVKTTLEKHGRTVEIERSSGRAAIQVYFQGEQELDYQVRTDVYPNRVVAHPATGLKNHGGYSLGAFRSGA